MAEARHLRGDEAYHPPAGPRWERGHPARMSLPGWRTHPKAVGVAVEKTLQGSADVHHL